MTGRELRELLRLAANSVGPDLDAGLSAIRAHITACGQRVARALTDSRTAAPGGTPGRPTKHTDG